MAIYQKDKRDAKFLWIYSNEKTHNEKKSKKNNSFPFKEMCFGK